MIRVVQVPVEATARKSRLSVKTRPTFDPSSRMTSRCQDTKQWIDSIDVYSRNLPASHILKSQNCTDDSIVLTGKLPKKAISTVIIEIDRGEEQSDDAISKITYNPTSKKNLETSYCNDRSRDQSVIFIKCFATPCKDLLPVTQYSVRDISRQKSKVTSSPSDCKFARSDQKIDISEDDAFSQRTCRKGVEPSEISSFPKKSLKRFKRRICPTSCCHSVRQTAIKETCKDFLRAKPSDVTFVGKDDQQSLDEQQLQYPVSKRMLRTEITRAEFAKSDKASTCQRSATAFRDACLIPGRIPEETLRLSSSQELLARYKEHIPIHLLEKYEICRSKRNGLQDECVSPFLQSILKKERQRRTLDNCIKRKRSIEQID